MDLPTVLARHLRDLAASVGADDDSLVRSLAALVTDLTVVTESYHGLRLTLVLDGWPVTLTAFTSPDGVPVATSLRISLSVLGDGFAAPSRVIFYATTPGAFVDLAADLAYALTRTDGLALDVDLPPVSEVAGVTGLSDYTVINRAIGVLIDRGHHPDGAHAALRRNATVSGLDPHAYAARLLRK